MKSEIQNPKSEARINDARAAAANSGKATGFGFRISDFGFRISASLLLLLALLSGCSRKAVSTNILARVGSHEITIQDFDREVQWYVKSRRPLPDKETVLEQMISRELRLQKAKASGLENDP